MSMAATTAIPTHAGHGRAKLAASQASSAIITTCMARAIEQRAGDAEALGDAEESRAAVEIHILAGVENVEAADP